MKGVGAIMSTCRGKWHEDEIKSSGCPHSYWRKWHSSDRIGSFELPLTQQENSVHIEIQSLDEKLKKLEKKHKFIRWSFDRQDLNTHQKVARGARRKEVLSKLHREATERCHLLEVKKHARGYDAMTRMADLLKKVNATNRRLIRDCNHLADLDSEEPLNALTKKFCKIWKPQNQYIDFKWLSYLAYFSPTLLWSYMSNFIVIWES